MTRMVIGSNPSHQYFVMAIAVAASATAAAIAYCNANERRKQRSILDWKKKRDEERTGRIRAEVKLRNALSNLKKQKLIEDSKSNNDNKNADQHVLPLSTIGIVDAPYPKRMGTPRQGQLVPSSRGCIQFVKSLPPEILDGIDEYSHLWVIFQFHENTSLATSRKTKIRPPRGGGLKVGQLSTRSPHRPNPLGLSLVTINRWDPSTRRLYINALDLVHGTPVYDVKPYVHWDIPSEVNVVQNPNSGSVIGLKLPHWVENKDDVLTSVVFEEEAEESLERIVRYDRLSPLLYPSKDPTSFEAAKQTLIEILSQDPRSSHRGLAKNQRGSVGKDDVYRLTFGKVIVEFIVTREAGAIVKNVVEAPPPSLLPEKS